jgi:hypothetical protein
LPAFLAQASLQYFDLALNVVYVFLQTGHFFSIQIASQYPIHASGRAKSFFPKSIIIFHEYGFIFFFFCDLRILRLIW